MNLKVATPPSSDSASSDEDEDKRTNMDENKEPSPCTRHINLFILVFLAGVCAASGVALLASAYLGNSDRFSTASTDSERGKLYKSLLIVSYYIHR